MNYVFFIFIFICKLIYNVFVFCINLLLRIIYLVINILKERSIIKRNNIKRGVVEYNSVNLNKYFDYGFSKRTLVTGMNQEIRNQIISSYIDTNKLNIILHIGDKALESKIKNDYHSLVSVQVINSNNPVYDPFFGLNKEEIVSILFEAIPQRYDLKYNASRYIYGMYEFLKSKNIVPTLLLFCKCPHDKLFDLLDDKQQNGTIDNYKANEIRTYLNQGQSEVYKIESYLNDLAYQFQTIAFNKISHKSPVNILNSDKGIIMIDIASQKNKLLLELIMSQINLGLKNKEINLICDNININQESNLYKHISDSNPNSGILLSYDNLYSYCESKTDVFNSILAYCNDKIILKHTNGIWCEKISDFCGTYDKEELVVASSEANNRGSTDLFRGYSFSKGKTIVYKRTYIIDPEQIFKMGEKEAYIYNYNRDELSHVDYIN